MQNQTVISNKSSAKVFLDQDAKPAMPKKKWTAEELLEYDQKAPVLSTKTYRIATYINAADKKLFPTVPMLPIPLTILSMRATFSMLKEIAKKHNIAVKYKGVTVADISKLLQSHTCKECPQFLTVFEPNKEPLTQAQRNKIHRIQNADTLASKEHQRYQTRTEEYHKQAENRRKDKHADSLFPPKPITETNGAKIVNNFVERTSFQNLEEYGCAVCGKLTSIAQLRLLQDVEAKHLECLIVPEVTRVERSWRKDPVTSIPGPVLDTSCQHICIKCHDSVKNGKIPQLALANGLWVGDIPSQLQNLSWTEQLLISRVVRNYCIVKVSKSKMHKMKANAICHAVPMPKIYSALPPKRSELDEVLAFLYIGPTKPTPEDLKRTPLLVRRNRVIDALEWLKLNHKDYQDIEISHKNMNEYSEDEPPVIVEYQEVQDVKDPEATAVNDTGEEEGTIEGECPFTVHTLSPEYLTQLIDKDQAHLLRNKALLHLKQGGKAMGITQKEQPESIYDNPQLYPQMFPWLFPYGLGGLQNIHQQRKVSDELHKQHLLMYHDKRFQKDPYFPLIAFNHEQIKKSSTGGWLLANKDSFSATVDRLMSVNESILTELISKFQAGPVKFENLSEEEKQCYKILNDIDYVAAQVPGSVTSRRNMRNEIWSLTSYLGAPSWFITFAPADINHPIAIYFAGSDQAIYPPNFDKDKRFWMIANNPVAGARFFKVMTDRKSTRLNSSHSGESRMPSSA